MCVDHCRSFAANEIPRTTCPHRGSTLRPNAMADARMGPLDEERTLSLRMVSAIDVVTAADIQAIYKTMADGARKALHW